MPRSGWIVLLTGLLMAAPLAAAAETVIKIGIVSSYTGFLAEPGAEMEKGISLYLREHEKDLPPGVKIELLRRDDGASPDIGKRVAQELITREHVNLLIGVVSSPVAGAIAPLTAEAKVPFIITNAAGVAIPRLSPYIVRVSFTIWQSAYPLGKWAAAQGYKRAYTAVSDFIPGHDGEDAFTKGFGDGGGTMVGSVRFPTANPDFTPFVQRIKDAKPDVAFVWVPSGTQATAMVKAMRDLGLREAGIAVVATQDLLPDEDLPIMGAGAVGIISAGSYSTAAERPANAAFLAAWDRAYGASAVPDFLSVDGWDGMAAAFDLIGATKGAFTADEAIAYLKAWRDPDSPRGPIAIDPATRDIVQNIYIRRVELRDGKPANIEFETIPAVKDPWKELHPQ